MNGVIAIQRIVNETNNILAAAQEAGQLSKRVLAVGIETNQLYCEYLEELETADLHIQAGITVDLDGQTIHFKSQDGFAEWVTESLS